MASHKRGAARRQPLQVGASRPRLPVHSPITPGLPSRSLLDPTPHVSQGVRSGHLRRRIGSRDSRHLRERPLLKQLHCPSGDWQSLLS